MKERKGKTTWFLLLCAMLFAFSGVLHPLLHHHCGRESTDGRPELYSASSALLHPPDDLSCPFCTGVLNGIVFSGNLLPELPSGELIFFSGRINNPLFSGYDLHLSRAPPHI